MECMGVQGALLDAALLFSKDPHGLLCLKPEAQTLLYRLCYSNPHTGILFSKSKEEFDPQKESLLRSMGSWHMLYIKNLDDCRPGNTLKEVISAWAVPAESCIFLTSHLDELLKDELCCQGWTICLMSDTTSVNLEDKELTIQHLQELPFQIASLNKAFCHEMVIVGYTMKWNREKEFLKRGAFPLHPTDAGLSFFPVNLEQSLPQQLAIVDLILHKPTDEITCITLEESGNFVDQIKFSDGMQRLIRFLHDNPHICVVDPIERILPLLDRALTQAILQGLSEVIGLDHPRIRSPHFLKVTSFDDPALSNALNSVNIPLPTIVKPQVACGVLDAHKMAVVFKHDGYIGLEVPTPSTIQEYVDHGSKQYKFYVIGSKVFYSTRRSTPNAAMLAESARGSKQVPSAIVFDSLKSLPVNFTADDVPSKAPSTSISDEPGELDLERVHSAAMWLREKLNLTIFGFDVVVQVATQDHVIVDVNFFPSFKDVDDDKAIPAFWEALRSAASLHKEARFSKMQVKEVEVH